VADSSCFGALRFRSARLGRTLRCTFGKRLGSLGVLCTLSGALLGATWASSAHALPLITLSGGVRLLQGTPIKKIDPDPYGLGLGVRLGVTLPGSLYLGGALDYFFGESKTLDDLDQERARLEVMGRIGYDVGLGPLLIRPVVGIGLARTLQEFKGATSGAGATPSVTTRDNLNDLLIAPGFDFGFDLGLMTLGLDARYNWVPSGKRLDGTVVGLGVGVAL
jgi:hypothetical protein